MRLHSAQGFTFIEILLAGMTLTIAMTALLGAFIGQLTLNEHARNLSLAIHDANRIIEQVRQENIGCNTPHVDPTGFPRWDDWIENAANGGKSLNRRLDVLNNDNDNEELIVVTCLQRNPVGAPPPLAQYCGTGGTPQVGAGEWRVNGGTLAPPNNDPLQVTVSVCWRHRNRTIGECSWNGAALGASVATDADNDGVIESPATLTTLVTCRG